jgi:zeaxanthin glucosyltransferase
MLTPHQDVLKMSMYVTIFDVARFLFVTVPLVAHVWPAAAVGAALTAAGHDVAWCGSESDLRPLVGPDAAIYPTGKRSFRQPARMGMDAVREVWDDYLMPFNRFLQDPVESAVTEHKPDVVVADQYALAGALAAYRHGVPWATLATGVMELTPPAEPGLQEWIRERLALVWKKAGVPIDDGLDLRFSPYLVIATTTQGLTGLPALPQHWLLAGAMLGPRPTDPGFPWDRWDPGQRHVLVTAGTVSAHLAAAHLVRGFFARMTAALAPMAGRVQAVFNVTADAVPDPPPHALVAPRVPMLDLMPRLDAVVCQAGQSTVNEALVNGVPLVVAPIRLAEPVTAQHVTRAGAGIEVSFVDATPAQLAAAVTAVLEEPGYRARARRFGEEFAAAGGTGAAAAALAALATGR